MGVNLCVATFIICGVYYFGHVEGSRSRSSSTRWTRHRYEQQYTVRVYDSHYKQDWLSYGRDGYLYGYNSYLKRTLYVHDNIPPTICFSDEYKREIKNEDYEFYESIVCPKENQTDDMNVCCGTRSDNAQYCCTSEAKKQNDIIAYVGSGLGALVLVAGAVCWCMKMKNSAFVAACCSKIRGNRQQTPATGQESHPLNTVPDSSVQYPRQTMPEALAQYPYQGMPSQEKVPLTTAPYSSTQPGAMTGDYQQNNYVA